MHRKQLTAVRIGTSNIVVPGTKADFPPEYQAGTRLQYYASLFNSLEVNSSFYKVPLPATFEKWAGEVPDDFKFTVKLWRGITHAPGLAYTKQDIDKFIAAANRLGNKRGCLLIQFPPSIKFKYHREVQSILQHLDHSNKDNGWNLTAEMRHSSWYNDAAYEMFEECNTSLVFHDKPESKTPHDQPATKVIYLRFHGPSGNYRDNYEDDFLHDYAEQIKDWRKKGKEVYVYFNNTIGGAYENAQLLKHLM